MFTPRQVKRKITDSPNPHPQNQGSHIRFAQDDNPPKRTRSNASTPHALTPITTPQTSSSTKQQELVLGLELILSDYSYHNPEASLWLKDRERTLNGEAGYIHFSSLLTHSVFARTKPIPTQPALKEALLEYPSSHLELHPTTPHLRRRPQVLNRSEEIPPKDWSTHTIYVEPHLASISLNPPSLVHHLATYGSLPTTHFPIQHVNAHHASYALMTFPAAIDDEMAGRTELWPGDWIVLSLNEHRKRVAEYVALVSAERRANRSVVDNRA